MKEIYHSVKLIEENCIGCSRCMTKCPVEAIRLKNSKAVIYEGKCIDCGECIKVCQHNAHKADLDNIEAIKDFKVKVVIPSVTIYTQFGSYINPSLIDEAVKSLGFDEVYDITYACDIVSEIIKKEIESTPKPAIGSFCPAVVRLIEVNYPTLIEHVIKVLTPIEVAASLIREKYAKLNYKPEDVGIFYITPCVSWITKVKNTALNRKSQINGAIPMSDIYPSLLKYVNKNKSSYTEKSTNMSYTGVLWAVSGGQCRSMEMDEFISVDGTKNVIKVLNDIENGKFRDVKYVEPYACDGGCVGGVLLVENPYNAKRIALNLNEHINFEYRFGGLSDGLKNKFTVENNINKNYDIKLADDFESAVKKMKYMNNIINSLPGNDCGQCGSPSCRAFAEDVVKGLSSLNECKFIR